MRPARRRLGGGPREAHARYEWDQPVFTPKQGRVKTSWQVVLTLRAPDYTEIRVSVLFNSCNPATKTLQGFLVIFFGLMWKCLVCLS